MLQLVTSEENKTENNSELSKQLDVIESVENMADINLKTMTLLWHTGRHIGRWNIPGRY